MTTYGFNQPKAEILSRHASMLAGQVNGGTEDTGEEIRIVRVPIGVTLGARSDSDPAVPLAASTFLDEYDMSQVGNLKASGNELFVYNMTTTIFGEDDFLLVGKKGDYWMAIAGSGTGSAVTMMISTTVLPANGSGSANPRSWNGTWTTATSVTHTVINPWGDPVSTGKLITAYKNGTTDEYIMIQAECEDAE